MVKNREHCMVCGTALLYRTKTEEVVCFKCGAQDLSAIICPNDHYICDTCHSRQTLEQMDALIERIEADAPEDILEELLTLQHLPKPGREHPPLAGLALLLACKKGGLDLPTNFIHETIRRSLQIPGGTCGYHGACGGAVSLGVAVSLITGATPTTGLARSLAQRATAMALLRCSDDESRCCQRALRNTVRCGREFFSEELGIEFPQPVGHQLCSEKSRNLECAKQHCPYFRRKNQNRFQ